MARDGLRVGLLGATGALGSEVLAVLAESGLPIAELVPMATEASLGTDIELRGELYGVATGMEGIRGLDLLILCTPAAVSLDAVREALRASVPCIDASGALAASPEVALKVAALGASWPEEVPLVVAPTGAALALALVLQPLAAAAGLARVGATLLEGASSGGRGGIEALYQESVALFNQQDIPEPGVFARPVAFDCIPLIGEVDANGSSDHENALARCLARLVDPELRVGVTAVQVPIFAGLGAALAIETVQPLDAKQAVGVLARATGVELWLDDARAATTRTAAGRDAVLVARVRPDPASANGLALWLCADTLRLAAANAVGLALARFGS